MCSFVQIFIERAKIVTKSKENLRRDEEQAGKELRAERRERIKNYVIYFVYALQHVDFLSTQKTLSRRKRN